MFVHMGSRNENDTAYMFCLTILVIISNDGIWKKVGVASADEKIEEQTEECFGQVLGGYRCSI